MSVYHFEEERFRSIAAAFLNCGGNFQEMPLALKKQMRVVIYENIPQIWVCDGFTFMEAHFTKDAMNEFRRNFTPRHKFSHLRDKILVVTKWHVVMKSEDSRRSMTSFSNVSIQIVIEQFRPVLHDRPILQKDVRNLHREDDIKALIMSARQDVVQYQILRKHFFLNATDFQVPSAKDIFASEARFEIQEVPEKLESDQLMLDDDEDFQAEIAEREKERQSVLDYNKSILSEVSTQITQREIFRCQLTPVTLEDVVQDTEDFPEFKDFFNHQGRSSIISEVNDVQMIDTSSEATRSDRLTSFQPQYYDVKRLLIQEKGEEDYEFLLERKVKQMKDVLDDEFAREETKRNLEHYTSKAQSRLEFQRHLQMQRFQRQQNQINKKRKKRSVMYRIGYTANEIKDRVLRFMMTFNNTGSQENGEESILQMREDQTEEPRARAFSQENLRNDQSEMIETKTVASQFIGGYALSQYYCQQSVFNDGDITESEHDDEDEDPIASMNRLRTRHALAQVRPNMSLFKRYIDWFQSNEVTSKQSHDSMLQAMREAALLEAAKAEQERLERERQEELQKEQERIRLEAEQAYLKELELQKQRKLEEKQEKQRVLEQERLKKQQEMEQLKREHEEQLRLERERLERERVAWEQEQERIKVAEAEEMARREAQLEAQRRDEERQRRLDEEKQEKKRIRLQEEKERLKREIEEQRRKDEERKAVKEQQRQAAIRKAEEEERERQTAIEAERVRAETEKKLLEEQAFLKKQLAQKEFEERQRKEAAEEKIRLTKLEELRMRKEAEQLEKQRLEREAALEAAAEAERKKLEEAARLKKVAEDEARKQKEQQIEQEKRKPQRVPIQERISYAKDQEMKRNAESALIQRELAEQLEERSSCSDESEMTPAFQNDPSDNEDMLQNNSLTFHSLTQQSATSQKLSSVTQSPQFGDQTYETHDQSSISLQNLLEMKKLTQQNPSQQNALLKQHHSSQEEKESIKLGKRKHKKARKQSSDSDEEESDEESESNRDSSVQSSENERQSSSGESDSDQSGQDSDGRGSSSKSKLKELAKIISRLGKQIKNKTANKHDKQMFEIFKSDYSKALLSSYSSKKKSGKRSSSHKKHHHHSSTRDQSPDKKKKKERVTSAFTLEPNRSPESMHESGKKQYSYTSSHHQEKNYILQQDGPQQTPRSPPPLVHSSPLGGRKEGGMTTFEMWQQNQSTFSSSGKPKLTPPQVNHSLTGSENVPDNGQYPFPSSFSQQSPSYHLSHKHQQPQVFKQPLPIKELAVADASAPEGFMEDLDDLNFYNSLQGKPKKRMKSNH